MEQKPEAMLMGVLVVGTLLVPPLKPSSSPLLIGE